MKFDHFISVEIERGKKSSTKEELHMPIASWELFLVISKFCKFRIF